MKAGHSSATIASPKPDISSSPKEEVAYDRISQLPETTALVAKYLVEYKVAYDININAVPIQNLVACVNLLFLLYCCKNR